MIGDRFSQPTLPLKFLIFLERPSFKRLILPASYMRLEFGSMMWKDFKRKSFPSYIQFLSRGHLCPVVPGCKPYLGNRYVLMGQEPNQGCLDKFCCSDQPKTLETDMQQIEFKEFCMLIMS